ncbi:uncharacterized protein [Pseudorca crassidens]|uniref:uncharacterized protein n=1 Tax=Pseudorca crassidens TaxID=82174 RepID=UPI00352D6AE0
MAILSILMAHVKILSHVPPPRLKVISPVLVTSLNTFHEQESCVTCDRHACETPRPLGSPAARPRVPVFPPRRRPGVGPAVGLWLGNQDSPIFKSEVALLLDDQTRPAVPAGGSAGPQPSPHHTGSQARGESGGKPPVRKAQVLIKHAALESQAWTHAPSTTSCPATSVHGSLFTVPKSSLGGQDALLWVHRNPTTPDAQNGFFSSRHLLPGGHPGTQVSWPCLGADKQAEHRPCLPCLPSTAMSSATWPSAHSNLAWPQPFAETFPETPFSETTLAVRNRSCQTQGMLPPPGALTLPALPQVGTPPLATPSGSLLPGLAPSA